VIIVLDFIGVVLMTKQVPAATAGSDVIVINPSAINRTFLFFILASTVVIYYLC
jgi:hypothetical protein